MQVILLEKIDKTGKLGEIVNVKAGFGRNFLIPTGKAKPATKANLAEFETIRAELEAKEAASKDKAVRIQEKMNGVEVSIIANAGEEGKLFGSVGPAEIAAALVESGFEVEKRDVDLSEAIRNVGEYEASVSLWADVNANIKVVVSATDSEEE
jgi:large subunit ribosomal protein L9